MDLQVIKGPDTQNRGPATNEGSEFGDTWKAAVDKINANFKIVWDRLSQAAGNAEHAIADEVKGLHDRVTAVEQKPADEAEALHQRISDIEGQLRDALNKLASTAGQ